MVLEGVVTNVAAFGAFVDVGVHQDGLVHVSELAHRFVKDPAEVVKVGDRVKVRVLKVDVERKRIGLSVKQASAPAPSAPKPPSGPSSGPRPPSAPRPPSGGPPPKKPSAPPPPPGKTPFNNPFAAAFGKK
jgi:uncharacterized protein